MTKQELKRALGSLCMLAVFGASYIARHEHDEHDEHKARSKLVFTPDARRQVRETAPMEPKPLV